MDQIMQFVQSLGPDFPGLIKTGGILLLGMLITSLLGRFVFGKRSVFCCAVSTAISILFIYALTVIAYSAGAQFSDFVAPLPFASISGTQLVLFSFESAHYTLICSELTSMVVLAFFVSLAEGWLPKGNRIFSWIFFRCLTVVIAFLLHLLINWVFTRYLPQGIITYAPTILLGLLILMILTGALKLLVGLVLSTVNPLIGALYTFFFANVVGKQITKAVLSTALLAGLVMLLQYFGCGVISFALSALTAYIPFLILLIALWYHVTKAL